MTVEEQWQEFRRRLTLRFPNLERHDAAGASNLPFLVANGFRHGLFNLNTTDCEALKADGRPLVLVGRTIVPPNDVLAVAVVFEGDDFDALGPRLDEIRQEARNSSKVRVYIHESGIYCRQSRDPDEIDPETFGRPIPATTACFADVERESHLEPTQVAYVNYLTALLRPVEFLRLDAQGNAGGQSALNLSEVDFGVMCSRIRDLGAQFSDEQVARYHIALNHLSRKHFVLLTGISGTGKTLLAKSYAYAAFGIQSLDLSASDFHLIPVHPEWTEPAQLLGYYDAISGSYRRTPFLNALLDAVQNQLRPVFVCLDEMNLAQPEYYFADILSRMETGGEIRLHDYDEEDLGVPRSVPWPSNLYITGTVNVDETTRSLSPKILDRANVIDMCDVDVVTFCNELSEREDRLANVLSGERVELLSQLAALLQPSALHFGYRTIEEVANFLAFAAENDLLEGESLDRQIEQKILTKLRGGPELSGLLANLVALLSDYPTSLSTVRRFQRDLDHYGSFQYWT